MLWRKKNLSIEAIAEEAPIIKMVLVILRHAIEGNASDIHIEPGREKLTVRFPIERNFASKFIFAVKSASGYCCQN